MPSLMDQYKGKSLKDLVGSLTKEQFEEHTFAISADKFGEEVVSERDVLDAFPPDMFGIINYATIRLGLVDEDIVGWLNE